MSNKKPIIEVKNLRTYFNTDGGVAHAVENVSFDVYPGETLGIVGESGCGKSVTALSNAESPPTGPRRSNKASPRQMTLDLFIINKKMFY